MSLSQAFQTWLVLPVVILLWGYILYAWATKRGWLGRRGKKLEGRQRIPVLEPWYIGSKDVCLHILKFPQKESSVLQNPN